MKYPYMYQGDSLTIYVDGKMHVLNRETHPNYEKIVTAIREEDWDGIPDLVDMTRAIANYTSDNGDIEVKDGDVYYLGRPFHNAITDRLIQMLEEGFPVDALCEFLANLKLNPSKRAVDELYGFLENNNLPITPDGHFLAYKKVRADFTDSHTGKFDNSPGQIVEMPRNEVNEDRDQTCSAGLHFCSLSYLSQFHGERVVILKINPRDVVSIPSDYNNAKGRTCRYEVVEEKSQDGRDTVEAFSTIVVDVTDYTAPREVKDYGNGQWRYVDNGWYATMEDVLAWQRYLDGE